jgi:23S rRNA (adenine-N6)-dimethyltransferase
VPGRRRPAAPNPAGAHFLRDAALIARLVRASGAGDGRLVLDLGAGHGAITAALASTGARVIAIERDPRCAARLRRRIAGIPRISVVQADLREVPLPRRDFLVVASVPFSITTALLRRLAGDPSVPMAGAELITAWGVARWLTAPVPRDAETAWWTARYQMRIAGRVPAASFAPPPRISAAHLSIRPRPLAASPEGQRLLRLLLRSAYRWPDAPVHDVARDVAARGSADGRIRKVLLQAGVGPEARAGGLTAEQWHQLALGALHDRLTPRAARRPSRSSPPSRPAGARQAPR